MNSMGLRNLLKKLTNNLFTELELNALTWIAHLYQLLIILVLTYKLTGHVTPDDLEQRTVLHQMLLHLVVQAVQASLDLSGRILLDRFLQAVHRQVKLIRDVLGLSATLDFGFDFLEKILNQNQIIITHNTKKKERKKSSI